MRHPIRQLRLRNKNGGPLRERRSLHLVPGEEFRPFLRRENEDDDERDHEKQDDDQKGEGQEVSLMVDKFTRIDRIPTAALDA